MKSLLSFSLSLAAFICPVFSVSLTTEVSPIPLVSGVPQSTPVNTVLPAPSQSANASQVDASEFICIPNRHPLKPRRLIRRQCNGAIELLPQDPAVALFHRTGPETDRYFLPRESTFEHCKVRLGLDYGYNTEVSSWQDLVLVAYRLSEKCAGLAATEEGMLGANKAAYVPAGNGGRIRIYLEWYESAPGENNSTVSLGQNTTLTDDVLTS